MTESFQRLAERAPSQGVARPVPREFDGIPGMRNSQALRDWIRATDDLDRAKHLHAPHETISELSHAVARAYVRMQALSARRR